MGIGVSVFMALEGDGVEISSDVAVLSADSVARTSDVAALLADATTLKSDVVTLSADTKSLSKRISSQVCGRRCLIIILYLKNR